LWLPSGALLTALENPGEGIMFLLARTHNWKTNIGLFQFHTNFIYPVAFDYALENDMKEIHLYGVDVTGTYAYSSGKPKFVSLIRNGW
jgi:hypothetical protein